MAHILSMQSHVVYGHAGNAAAVFPMQRLGHQVLPLNLLQFSNHTGYGTWGGQAISAAELQSVFEGLRKIGALKNIDGIVTGYIGSAEQVEIMANFISEIKILNPRVIYCCDPVTGDEHTGTYAKPEVLDAIRTHLLKRADIITPNKYELSLLTNQPVTNLKSIVHACEKLMALGPKNVLATSANEHADKTGLLFFDGENANYVETNKYVLQYTVRGTGDATAAMFLSHLLTGENTTSALEKTANAIHAIAKYSHDNDLCELAVIQCQQEIAHPTTLYQSHKLLMTKT